MPASGTTEAALRATVRDFLSAETPALRIIEALGADLRERMRREVLAGLGDPFRSGIPSTYFYDQTGSELYEQITALPEYYPTRTEASLLRQIAPRLADSIPARQMVELGSGSSAKTRLLLDAFHAGESPLTYVPIDVSRGMLRDIAGQLVEAYPGMRVLGLAAQFDDALDLLPLSDDRLVLFLGGTLGNFTPLRQDAFFAGLRRAMRPGNHLLLGFDRRAHPGKPASVIHAAYNDAHGVTAQFNLNLLTRLNRELEADFRLACWQHRAFYNAAEHQIEMVLESTTDQAVRVAGQLFFYKAGESILTEISRKFDPDELASWLARQGFVTRACWMDEREVYGLMLVCRVHTEGLELDRE